MLLPDNGVSWSAAMPNVAPAPAKPPSVGPQVHIMQLTFT